MNGNGKKKVMICLYNPEHPSSARSFGETIERFAPGVPLGFDYSYDAKQLPERVIGNGYSLVFVENVSAIDRRNYLEKNPSGGYRAVFVEDSPKKRFEASLDAIAAIKKAEKDTPVVSFGDQIGGERAMALGADDYIDTSVACFGRIADISERYLMNGQRGRLTRKYLSIGNNGSTKRHLIGVSLKAA